MSEPMDGRPGPPGRGRREASRVGLRVLRVDAGGAAYSVDMAAVRGIQRRDQLPVGEDGEVARTLVVDGMEAPLRRLAELVGEAPAASADSDRVVLILAAFSGPVVLLVDRVSAAREAGAGDVVPMPRLAQPRDRRMFTSAVLVGDDVLPLLDPARLHPEGPAPRPLSPVPGQATELGAREGTVTHAGTARRLLRIQLGDPRAPLALGLSLRQVAEILAVPPIRALPGLAPHVHGLFAWRGRAVPAVALGRSLGVTEPAADRLVVAQGTNGEFLGLLAPAALAVETLGALCRPTAWQGPAAAPILGSFETPLGPLALLDVDRVLAGAG